MAYKGRFSPRNPSKYKGDASNIIYRSMWERSFMVYCDNNSSIIQWSSEELVIPYVCPLDGRYHRYFTDFWIKAKAKDDTIKQYVIEIKPYKETIEPVKPSKKSRKYVIEVAKYLKNKAKWAAAEDYCRKTGATFMILTEYELNLKKRKS